VRGTLSIHPVDVNFFDSLIQPLVSGQKVNPEEFVQAALRVRAAAEITARYVRALEVLLEGVAPPPPITEGRLWDRVRSRLERFDHRPDPTSVRVARAVDPELHLRGRPFFITEGSSDRVATFVDEYRNAKSESEVEGLALEQLVRLDPQLGRAVKPDEGGESVSKLSYRSDVLRCLKDIHDLARAAAAGDTWAAPGQRRRTALEALASELPWRAVRLHSLAVPFWIAHNVDGLETICRAAGVAAPDVLVPAWRLFGEACERFPSLRERLGCEVRQARDVGAFVSPADVPRLLSFLNAEGARIIQIATRHGEGPACATLLRKIRECASYAASHSMGYLEASGIRHPWIEEEEEEQEPAAQPTARSR
jgi:hypothetical protein